MPDTSPIQFYIAGEGDTLGPYSVDQVQDLVRKGELTGQELAYHEGLENWAPLSEILPAEPTSEEFKYKAFISYSHQDKKWGDWLHKSLETYSIPKGLIGRKTSQGEVPKRLFPVFRDREELPTATELGTMIDGALKGSSHLVVICSPRSAKSQWVNEEIKQFKRLGKSDRILCLIVDGEPNGADKPEMGMEECFPEAVKYELGEDGELSEERTEPIAADAREGKDGKANALLKLVAGLLGVGFDDLKQRDAVRRQRRMMVLSGISGALALVMGGLAIWAWTQRNEAVASRQAETQQRKAAETQRQKAVKQKGIAEENLKKAELENYFNVISLAQSKINEREYDQAKEMLWKTPSELRNWEWGHLMQLCHSELLLTLNGHGHFVRSAAFSSDGKRVVTGSEDRTAKIWDAASGTELLTLKGHGSDALPPAFSPNLWVVYSVAFSPDGKRVVTGSVDTTAKIWDVETGKELLTLGGGYVSRCSRIVAGGVR